MTKLTEWNSGSAELPELKELVTDTLFLFPVITVVADSWQANDRAR
jgi:hypothetical protein